MQADTPQVEAAIQSALANESSTVLFIQGSFGFANPPPLTVNDARCIIACLRENPRINTLSIFNYSLHNHAVLNVFRDGLPLCTSLTTVKLHLMKLANEDLERLRPAFYNNSITSLHLYRNNIQGRRGGEVIQDLLRGNNTLVELNLMENPIGPEGAIGLGRGLPANNRLQTLDLYGCNIGNEGLVNFLLPTDGMINSSLMQIYLDSNAIKGAEGGRQVSLLLQRFQQLKLLYLNDNPHLGPLGARALAPGLAASNLKSLGLYSCGLGNDGVASLIPDRQVNRTLTYLSISGNGIRGLVGQENVITLAERCTNLDRIHLDDNTLSPDDQRRLDLVLERKRLHTEAQALGSSPSSVIFEKLLQANSHEHGLSASFVILRDHIFAEQQKSNSSADQNVQAAVGLKRKR